MRKASVAARLPERIGEPGIIKIGIERNHHTPRWKF